jgi:hypothetical protein
MSTLQVDLGERSYPIYIEAGLLDDPALLRGTSPVIRCSSSATKPWRRCICERLRAALGNGPDSCRCPR